MRSADTLLGAKASGTELVAVVANPTYTGTAFTAAFTRQEGLSQVRNWMFLTGSLSQLADVWHHYGIKVENLPAGAMSAHNDLAFVISTDGHVRQEISDDPGPGTAVTQSSFAGLLAGCAASGAPAGAAAVPAVTSPLVTSLAGADGVTWAIVTTGGFWELLARPAASTRWSLVTPPAVAGNGGLVAVAPAARQRLDVAVRPSLHLSFSPLALTSDGGRTWGTGLIDAPVAAVPDALAADGGTMLALLSDGTIDQAPAPGANWTLLAAPGAVARAAAARGCQVTGLTGIALTASGTPLAAASCARPGTAGIFAFDRSAGTWRAAGPLWVANLYIGDP